MIDVGKLSLNVEMREDGLWFSKEQASVHYPEEGNEWCQQIEENSFWFKHRNNCITTIMKHYPPSGPIFDIGGGNGFVALAIQKAGYDVIVVEPGISGARYARKRGIETVICSTIENVGFGENTLAAVGLFDVIEHIPEDTDFLKTMRRYLGPDGRLYITVPAYQFLWSTDDEFACHFRRYSMKTLLTRLKESGFYPEYATYFFSFLPVPIFLFRTVLSKLGFRKKLRLEQERTAHELSGTISGSALNWLLRRELRILERKGRLPFGGSCLVVAKASK
jgi:SAM-dependent methyltransferase